MSVTTAHIRSLIRVLICGLIALSLSIFWLSSAAASVQRVPGVRGISYLHNSGKTPITFHQGASTAALAHAQAVGTQAQANDAEAVRAVVENYFARFAAKDLEGLLSLWSVQSPEYATLKQSWQRQFVAEDFRLNQTRLTRLKVDGGKASLRAAVQLTVLDVKSRQSREQQIIRNFDLVKEAESWKVWRATLAENDLAELLGKAQTEAERTSLLAAEPELVTADLVKALINQGVQLRNQRNHPQALAIHRLALSLSEQLGDRIGMADALRGLADDYRVQDNLVETLEYLQRSLAIITTLRDEPRLAAILGSLGIIHHLLGNEEEARESYQQALPMFEALGDKSRLASALLGLGNVNRSQGDYPAALRFYQQALRLAETLGDKVRVAGMLNNLGLVYAEQGNYAQALAAYQQGLALDEAANDRTQMALKLNNIGLIHHAQGHNALALAYYEKALALNEALGSKRGLLFNLFNSANIYRNQGNYGQALALYQRSLTLSEALGDKAGIANTLNNIGYTNYLQANYALALEHYQKSLSLREALGDKVGITTTLNFLAEFYQQQGLYAEALATAARAAALARQTGNAEQLWSACLRVGVANRALKEPVRARQAFEEAIRIIETLRTKVVGGGEDQQRYFSRKVPPYHALVDLLIGAGQPTEALGIAERAKARVLLDVLQSGSVNITKAMTASEHAQERKLKSQLVALNTQVSREAAQAQPNQARLTELNAQREQARLEFAAFQTTLYAAHPELKAQRGEAEPLTPERLSALLPDSATALLEYVVTPDQTFLFVITQTNGKPAVQTYTLPIKQTELARQIETLRRQLAARDLGFRATATRLYDLLLKPAQAQLKGKTRLVIVPDGQLWELPFQALPTGAHRYLIEDATLSYAPSLTVLREMMKRPKPSTATPTLLALGNPALGKETVERATFAMRDSKFEPLPEAESEVVALGKLYGAAHSKVFTGAAAREDRTKAEAGQRRVLHFATHGVLNDAAPLYSHLVLTQSEQEDGLLEAWELLQMDLHADLAVLSACETARGQFGAGEGMIGLSWALFVAGVPTTVVSQWKVEAAATRELMVAFHRQLRTAPTTKAAALRQAALAVLKRPATSHPFYWAGFVLVGDGR